MRSHAVGALTCGLLCMIAVEVHAGGYGRGLRSGASALGPHRGVGPSSGAVGPRAYGKVARSTRGMSSAGSSLSRAANGLNRNALAAPQAAATGVSRQPHSRVTRLPDTGTPPAGTPLASQPAANAERILQHRLNQADHLDGVAARNGNERLAENAERMRAQAQQQYNDRMQRLGGLPDSAPPAPVGQDPTLTPPLDPVAPAQNAPAVP